MMKKGFTIQEVLITLGIVGIVAAVTAPALVKVIPNQEKARYIKAYSTLTELTQQMLNDPALYWITYDNNTGMAACEGLECTDRPQAGTVPNSIRNNIPDNPTAVEKYAGILASYMHLKTNFVAGNTQFTTSDETMWQIVNPNPNPLGANALFSVNILLPINNRVPFTFDVTADGRITARDSRGAAYLQNPTDLHNKARDEQIAADLISNPDGIPGFYLAPKYNFNDGNLNITCDGYICSAATGIKIQSNPNSNSQIPGALLAPAKSDSSK